MKPIFMLITLLVVASLVPGAAAQANGTNITVETPETTDDEVRCTEHIDEDTSICSAEYENGRAVILLESDRPRAITVTDAGGVFQGGEVSRQRFHLSGEERSTVSMPVTKYDGFAGVTIDTGTTLYAVPLEAEQSLISGPWTSDDVRASGIGTALSVSLVTLLLVMRAVRGKADEPEQVA